MLWYPPAESNIPFSAIIGAFHPNSDRCDKILGKYFDGSNYLLGNSGRSLLYLLLKELHTRKDKQRDTVIIPGYTCYSVAASVVKAGLKLRLYDVECKTLHPDLSSLKSAVSSKTLAIIHQHLFGIPTSIEGVRDIARENGIFLIEDGAQALGGIINGKLLGTLGDFGLFSFGRGKPLPIGVGGALISKDEEIFKRIEIKERDSGWSSIGIAAVSKILTNPIFYGILEKLPLGLGKTDFNINFKSKKMPLLAKNMLIKSIPFLDQLNLHRRRISKIYSEAFNSKDQLTGANQSTAVYTRFPILVREKYNIKKLLRYGVRRMYPKAIADEDQILPYIDKTSFYTPESQELANKLITLPTHIGITDKTAVLVTNKIKAENIIEA